MILESLAVFRNRADVAIARDLLLQEFSTLDDIQAKRGVFGFTLIIHQRGNRDEFHFKNEVQAYCRGIRDALEAQGR